MQYGWTVPIAIFAVICCSDAIAQSPDEDTALAIDTGRMIVMLDQVSTLMKLPEKEEAPSESPVEALDFVVARYNVLKEKACARDIVEGAQCDAVYAPALQAAPVSLPVLRREVDDVENRILPFWEEVCAELDDPAHPSCQLE